MPKLIKILLFIVCTLILNPLCHSQRDNKVDSLLRVLDADVSNKVKMNVYINLADKFQNTDSLKTIEYANKAMAIAKAEGYIEGSIKPLYSMGVINMRRGHYKAADSLFSQMEQMSRNNNYRKGLATALFGLGWLNGYLGNYKETLAYLNQSVEINKELGEKNSMALAYNIMGIVNDKQGYYNEALEYYFNSLEINEELDKKTGMASNYNNIGIIYRNQKNHTRATEFYKRALAIYQELEIKNGIASSYSNIGKSLDSQGLYDEALDYQIQSLKIKEELEDKKGIANSYNSIGQLYSKQGEYGKALDAFFTALKGYEALGVVTDKSLTLINIGSTYHRMGNASKAKKFLEEGIGLAQQKGSLNIVRNGASELAAVENSLGNYRQAYDAHVLYKQMEDSLDDEENVKEVTRLTANFEFQKEKDSLQLAQRQEFLLFQEQSKRKENLKLAIVICFILVVIIGLIIYTATNAISRRNELDSLRNQISRDLHDELGTTISSISLFGTVAQSNILKNPDKASELLELINSNATKSVESMNDIVWTINSEMDTIQYLFSRMRSFAGEIDNTDEWEIKITYAEEIAEKKLDMIQRRNVYYIFKEAVNNAVKYSEGNKVDVNLILEGNIVRMEITDNGKGFDLATATNRESNLLGGNGLKNMKKRAKELGGELKIKSELGKGTTVQLEFNIKHKSKSFF